MQRAFVRPLPAHPKPRQVTAVRRAGADRIYTVGEDGVESWRDLLRHLRAGDVVLIEGLALLPDPRGPGVPMPAQDMRDAIEAIEHAGASLVEIASGYRSTDSEQRAKMILWAAKSLSKGLRSLPYSEPPKSGPRGKSLDKHRDVILAIWDSRRYSTREAALDAMFRKGVPRVHYSTIFRTVEGWRGKGKGGRDVAAED